MQSATGLALGLVPDLSVGEKDLASHATLSKAPVSQGGKEIPDFDHVCKAVSDVEHCQTWKRATKFPPQLEPAQCQSGRRLSR